MTLSLGFVFALFLLAPGFGFYTGVYSRSDAGAFRPAPPPTGSVAVLAIVGMGALAAHVLWSALLAFDDWACGLGMPCVPFAFRTNMYAITLAANAPHPDLLPAESFVVLASLALLALAMFAVGRWGAGLRWARRGLYGELAPIVDALRDPERFLAVFVLVKVDDGSGVRLGYRGIASQISFGADRQITGLLLERVKRFTLKLHEGGLTTTQPQGGNTIPKLWIPGSELANVALAVADARGVDAAGSTGPVA